MSMPKAEEDYLAHHEELLTRLKTAFRSERTVRLAVLFGSTAVGDDNNFSDVDLLVVHRNPTPRRLAGLKLRLRRTLGRPVDVVSLGQAETMPTLLADILREGRVIVDRDGLWKSLLERWREISVAARREERATSIRARQTVAAARERIAALDERPPTRRADPQTVTS
jgi:predicted nucleotidyltransferase